MSPPSLAGVTTPRPAAAVGRKARCAKDPARLHRPDAPAPRPARRAWRHRNDQTGPTDPAVPTSDTKNGAAAMRALKGAPPNRRRSPATPRPATPRIMCPEVAPRETSVKASFAAPAATGPRQAGRSRPIAGAVCPGGRATRRAAITMAVTGGRALDCCGARVPHRRSWSETAGTPEGPPRPRSTEQDGVHQPRGPMPGAI